MAQETTKELLKRLQYEIVLTQVQITKLVKAIDRILSKQGSKKK